MAGCRAFPTRASTAAYQGELKTSFASIKAYQQKFYYHGNWKPDYDRWVAMLAGMYAGPGKERVARNQALTSDMVFTQPVVHEFARIKAPTVLIIGGMDRTAPRRQPCLARDRGSPRQLSGTRPRRRAGHSAGDAG